MDLNSRVNQVRLMVGDIDSEQPYYEDSVYEYLLTENDNHILKASIEGLENLITTFSFENTREKSGEYEVWGPNVELLEKRLINLKNKLTRKSTKGLFLVRTDREDWDDITSIYRDQY